MIYKVLVYVVIISYFLLRLGLSILNYNNRNAKIPKQVRDLYDKKEYKTWHEYNMENFKYGFIYRIFNIVLFISLLGFGFFNYIYDFTTNLVGSEPYTIIVFFGLYYMVEFILGIPFDYYDTFVIEEKYGFNKSTKKTFILDKIKALVLTAILGGGLLILIAYLHSWLGGVVFYVSVFGVISVLSIVINVLYVPVFVPMFNKLTPLEEGELKVRIEEFASKVGYTVGKISVMNASKRSSRLNAFFSGLGKVKNIVLYDTLMEKMTDEQIIAVLAHEIGHSKLKHIPRRFISTFISLAINLGVLFLVLTTKGLYEAFGFTDVYLGFGIVLFSTLVGPINMIVGLFTSAMSRKHEFEADHFAATKFEKQSMVEALKVLSKENFSNLTPHPLYVKVYYSHPPVAKRIKAINII